MSGSREDFALDKIQKLQIRFPCTCGILFVVLRDCLKYVYKEFFRLENVCLLSNVFLMKNKKYNHLHSAKSTLYIKLVTEETYFLQSLKKYEMFEKYVWYVENNYAL